MDAADDFPTVRAAQAAALPVARGSTDLTGLAVTLDLGDLDGGIHPHNKTEVVASRVTPRWGRHRDTTWDPPAHHDRGGAGGTPDY